MEDIKWVFTWFSNTAMKLGSDMIRTCRDAFYMKGLLFHLTIHNVLRIRNVYMLQQMTLIRHNRVLICNCSNSNLDSLLCFYFSRQRGIIFKAFQVQQTISSVISIMRVHIVQTRNERSKWKPRTILQKLQEHFYPTLPYHKDF